MFKALQCETRQKILKIIASKSEGYSSREISKKLGISPSIALKHLEQLENVGLLKRQTYQPWIGRPGAKFVLNSKIRKQLEIKRLGRLRFYVQLM
jgi:predicted ArsR family transcriptional regulator